MAAVLTLIASVAGSRGLGANASPGFPVLSVDQTTNEMALVLLHKHYPKTEPSLFVFMSAFPTPEGGIQITYGDRQSLKYIRWKYDTGSMSIKTYAVVYQVRLGADGGLVGIWENQYSDAQLAKSFFPFPFPSDGPRIELPKSAVADSWN